MSCLLASRHALLTTSMLGTPVQGSFSQCVRESQNSQFTKASHIVVKISLPASPSSPSSSPSSFCKTTTVCPFALQKWPPRCHKIIGCCSSFISHQSVTKMEREKKRKEKKTPIKTRVGTKEPPFILPVSRFSPPTESDERSSLSRYKSIESPAEETREEKDN